MKNYVREVQKLPLFMDCFDYWANASEGWTSLCIEKDPGGLEEEIAYPDTVGIKGVHFTYELFQYRSLDEEPCAR